MLCCVQDGRLLPDLNGNFWMTVAQLVDAEILDAVALTKWQQQDDLGAVKGTAQTGRNAR
jgi:hypothetical protein